MHLRVIYVQLNYLHGSTLFSDSKYELFCLCLTEFTSMRNVSHIHSIFSLSKQRGPEAEKANNVFYHLSYYDSEDLEKVEDRSLQAEIALHIADFGNCPSQLFFKPHPNKKSESFATQSKV